MKIDAFFPPPPQFNQPPLKCSDLTPGRQNALGRMSAFAAVAEQLVGSIPAPAADNPPLPFPATSRGFALRCLAASPFVAEVAALLALAKLTISAGDHVDAPHVMLIDVRRYWGVLGPLRGDVVLFADGNAAIVTQALCMGCQHFDGISLSTADAPQIVKQVHWASTVKWIIRLVDESPLPAPATPAPAEAAPAADAAPAPAPAPTDAAPVKAGKKTGIG